MNVTETTWNGFRCLEFVFQEKNAKLVFPKQPCEGKKWLLKTEYFGAFPGFEIEMLERGYHLAYVANRTRWHVAEDDDVKQAFCEFLHREYGLHEKCIPVGMSCGGLQAVYFASKYPERIAGLYIDAPVLNLLSCPVAVGRSDKSMLEEFQKHTGMTVSELINYRNHPIDHKETLLRNQIPIFLVAGDVDQVVPYEENGKVLYEYYKANQGDITQIVKEGCDHHPHGLEDVTPLIEFVERVYQ